MVGEEVLVRSVEPFIRAEFVKCQAIEISYCHYNALRLLERALETTSRREAMVYCQNHRLIRILCVWAGGGGGQWERIAPASTCQ